MDGLRLLQLQIDKVLSREHLKFYLAKRKSGGGE